MVWFYHRRGLRLPNAHYYFQSHYGLILSEKLRELKIKLKTELSIPLWSDFISFNRLSVHCYQNSFNPTMVWFYREPSQYVRRRAVRFQSHYGLILSAKNFECFGEAYFQSHYGLILSWTLWKTLQKLTEQSFNPTMVWFYLRLWKSIMQEKECLSIPLWSDFI